MIKKKPSTDHQKRLGQYFSGEKVGNLLVSLLPQDAGITSAVDPMAGIGDLLCAARRRAAPGARFLGVEIDGPVAEQCAENLPGCQIEHADAFSCESILTENGWDLVIANPPYVRYQLQQKDDRVSVRNRLHTRLKQLPYLDAADKAMLLRLTDGYSGLSDLAVPSWLLCAALVKTGGYLAIVVPDTWLSREYAKPIQYLLAKSFDVLTIVKDVSTSWFDNALVRTCLLVAKRRRTAPLRDLPAKETLCMDLSAEAMGAGSLVDSLEYDAATGPEALAKILQSRLELSGPGFTMSIKKTLDLFPYMLSGQAAKKWAAPEDKDLISSDSGHPIELLPVFAAEQAASFITLADLGIHCGQGLRTGANEFFYVAIADEADGCYTAHSKPWYQHPLTVPHRSLVRTLQNRGEAEGLVIAYDNLKTGLLYIEGEARPEDLKLCSSALSGGYQPLGPSLSDYITAAELYRNPRGAAFREYSAVAPNEKKDSNGYLRFWYMLPPLSKRHLPAMCINRVNAASTNCLYIPQSAQRPIVVDANFVTLWGDAPEQDEACLALLNSTWSKCYLECLCTVMGGGALKVETSHICKLQFPAFSLRQLGRLAACGRKIIATKAMSGSLQAEIDAAVLEPFQEPEQTLAKLRALLLRRLSERGAKL